MNLTPPTIGQWAPKQSNAGAPFTSIGCGDAWCVVDANGSLAWQHVENPLKALASKEVAELVAEKWNDSVFSGAR